MDAWHIILEKVRNGELSVEAAAAELGATSASRLGFATLDLQRVHRCGLPEVIYAPGKTAEQLVRIITVMRDAGQNVLASRVSAEQAAVVTNALPEVAYDPHARALTLYPDGVPEGEGLVSIVAAGTSDQVVAAEAAVTARHMGARIERISDVGVAGLHRLMPFLDTLRASNAVIVVAGMEGALPSVVGGLIDKPLIAVPTSVGYGASFAGLSALLTMLNSCVAGITVVNIDNGFGAGVAAARINRLILSGGATM